MRFGGHETFAVKEGWLTKGLRLVVQEPERLTEEFAEDYLGVGRNMVKAIRHWLVATGLAEVNGSSRGTTGQYEPTEFGRAIMEQDPHMLDPGTWWMLHLNLINNDAYAATWCWFFNIYNMARFERAVCVESLHRHLRVCQKRVPSPRTIERDVACLLMSYAEPVPRKRIDPEDASDCPFSELGLLVHYKGSGYYQMNKSTKPIPPHILGYAVALSMPDTPEIPLTQAARHPGGPGRGFQMSAEGLFETLLRYEEEDAKTEVRIVGLAGERMIQVPLRSPSEWTREYFCHGRQTHQVA